jgi:hypothetical protein
MIHRASTPAFRIGCLHLRPEVLPPRKPSSEESLGRRVPGAALFARLFGSSSAAGFHVPERRPRLLDGEADAGLDRGRPRAASRRRTTARGEGGVAGVGDGGRIGAAASTDAAPEPKTKEEAPVGAETKASASSALTSTRGAPGRRDTDGGNSMGGTPGLISTTVGVGDGTLGAMPSASGAAALEAEVGDWPRAPKPTVEVIGDGSEASSVGDAAGP